MNVKSTHKPELKYFLTKIMTIVQAVIKKM